MKKSLGDEFIETKERFVYIKFVGRVYEVDLLKETITLLPTYNN